MKTKINLLTYSCLIATMLLSYEGQGQYHHSNDGVSSNYLKVTTIPELITVSTKVYSNGTMLFEEDQLSENQILNILTHNDRTFALIKEMKVYKSENEWYHIYQQYYKGVKVDGGSVILHVDHSNLKVSKLKSLILTNINLDVVPAIAANDLSNCLNTETFDSNELIVTDRFSGNFELIWQSNYYDTYPKLSWIHAITGLIIETSDSRAFLPGTASIYGPVNLNNFFSSGVTFMKTPDEKIKVYDVYPTSPSDFDPNTIPTTTNTDNWHGDGHPQTVGVFYSAEIATYILEDELDETFGEVNIASSGDGTGIYPSSNLAVSYMQIDEGFGTIETLAHELTHVFLNEHLAYNTLGNESLHEGLAMLFSILVEGVHQSQIDWILHDDDGDPQNNYDFSNYTCFDNPPSGIGFASHNLGTTITHWFYLLVNGDSGLEIEALEVDDIRDVILQATPNVGMNGNIPIFSDETMIAAEQIFGICSEVYRSMLNAWSHVCLDVEAEECPCDDLAGPDLLVNNDDMTIDYDLAVAGNIIVSNGAKLTIDNALLVFLEDKRLIVQGGGSLETISSTLTSCDPNGNWGGIFLDDAATFTMESSTISQAATGIEIHNLATPMATFHDNLFRDCDYGIRSVWAENVTIEGTPDPTGQLSGFNLFQTCDYGIEIYGGSGSIKYAITDRCTNGIRVYNSQDLISITDSELGYLNYGIDVINSDVEILDNTIGNPTWIGSGIGTVGIKTSASSIEIKNNFIEAYEKGISTSFTFADAIIELNKVWLYGNNDYGVAGIYNYWTQDVLVSDNKISGSGHDVGIYELNCYANTVEKNTVQATGSDNGIAITGGLGNIISGNLVENAPTNGILNTSSVNNAYHDNDISADIQGLSIEPLSETQTITCNRFCEGNVDLNIESNLNRAPDHFWNQFRQTGSKARVIGLEPFEVIQSRFYFDPVQEAEDLECGIFELFVADDPAGVFVEDDEVNYIDCSEGAGSSLKRLTPTTLCDSLSVVSTKEYWLKLRQLLGRYFDQHGPKRLPDCITDCWQTEFTYAEAELRAVMRGEANEAGMTTSETFKSVAQAQFQSLSQVQETIAFDNPPCDTITIDDLYLETYIRVVKEIATEALSESDLSELRVVSELCYHEYGEVVGWARGLLEIYNEDFIEPDCTRAAVEQRAGRPSTESLRMTLRPVPTSALLYVELEGPIASKGRLSIIDIAGRVLSETAVLEKDTYTLDVSELAGGYYILRYENDQDVVMTESFIVQH